MSCISWGGWGEGRLCEGKNEAKRGTAHHECSVRGETPWTNWGGGKNRELKKSMNKKITFRSIKGRYLKEKVREKIV